MGGFGLSPCAAVRSSDSAASQITVTNSQAQWGLFEFFARVDVVEGAFRVGAVLLREFVRRDDLKEDRSIGAIRTGRKL